MANNLSMTTATYASSGQKFGTAALNGGYGETASPLVSNAASFTVECWAYRASAPSATKVIIGQSGVFWVGHTATGVATAKFGKNPTEVTITTSKQICDGAWHHIALTVNVSTGQGILYVDGVQVGTTTSTGAIAAMVPSTGLGIRAFAADTGGFAFEGLVDEVALWTGLKYTAGFTAPTAAYTGGESNIAGLWHLDSNGADAVSSAPSQVTGLTATAGNAQVALSWSAPADGGSAITDYLIEVSVGGGAYSTVTDGVSTGTSYTHTGLTNGTLYAYRVSAINALGTGTASASASATPAAPTVPAQVTGLTAVPGNAQVSLSWTAPSNGGSAITDYLIEVSVGGGAYSTVTDGVSTGTSYTHTGLTNGTLYAYRVSAINAVGTGAASTSASATPTAASVTIAPNNAAISYSPGNWLVGAGSAKTINAGACLRIGFTGLSCTLNFDVSNLPAIKSAIEYRVDGFGPWTRVSLSSGAVAVTIPTETADLTVHTLEVVVAASTETANRWNSPQNTAVVLTSITLANGATVSALQPRPKKILCFGDSITEGVRTIRMTAGSGLDADRNSARVSWAYALGDLLGAEVGLVGFGSQGMTDTGNGNVPKMATSYASMWAAQARDFTGVDLVVIMQGANDGSTNTTTDWTTCLNGLLAALPAAARIVVLKPFANAAAQAGYIQAGIAACSAPTRVNYINLDFFTTANSSDSLHPYGWENVQNIAPKVAAQVLPILNGPQSYPLVGTILDTDLVTLIRDGVTSSVLASDVKAFV